MYVIYGTYMCCIYALHICGIYVGIYVDIYDDIYVTYMYVPYGYLLTYLLAYLRALLHVQADRYVVTYARC